MPSLFSPNEHLSELTRIIKNLPLEDNPLCRIKPKFDEFIAYVEGKLAGYYSIGEGRPAYPVKRLLGMLLIQSNVYKNVY